ncbi:MAG: ABC transporter ATP-binding protein [Desulfobacterales bacterium]|nr:ABC transporter ATP-binding protein [Desulfobacterales bacterium]
MSSQDVDTKIKEIMEQVGVDPAWIKRFPHEFSGGKRQRTSIARGLILDPELIVADEPVSALDVSIQAQILNLLMEAGQKRDLTYLFITHDLSVVQHISTRVAVMYLGTLCELSDSKTLFENPRHPYTRALLSAIPKVGETKAKHIKLKGNDQCDSQDRILYTMHQDQDFHQKHKGLDLFCSCYSLRFFIVNLIE